MSMGLEIPGQPATDEQVRPWGLEAIIDLYGCAPHLIRSEKHIRQFLIDLVEHIGMIAHGEPLVDRFALDNPDAAGITAVQLITTSSIGFVTPTPIGMHFSEKRNVTFVNVFSCGPFDPHDTARFVAGYFSDDDHNADFVLTVLPRGNRRQ